MALVTLIEDPGTAAARLAWSRRIAASVGMERVVFCLLGEGGGDAVVRLKPEDEPAHPIAAAVREVEIGDDAARI